MEYYIGFTVKKELGAVRVCRLVPIDITIKFATSSSKVSFQFVLYNSSYVRSGHVFPPVPGWPVLWGRMLSRKKHKFKSNCTCVCVDEIEPRLVKQMKNNDTDTTD